MQIPRWKDMPVQARHILALGSRSISVFLKEDVLGDWCMEIGPSRVRLLQDDEAVAKRKAQTLLIRILEEALEELRALDAESCCETDADAAAIPGPEAHR